MPRNSDAKSRLIKTAGHLFRAKGYSAVGLAEILSESGAPKGSFYHHFPGGKEELALAVIDKAGSYIIEIIDQAFENSISVADGVDTLVDNIALSFEKSGFQLGCPVTAFITELTPTNDAFRKKTNQVLESWIERMLFHSDRLAPGNIEKQRFEAGFRALLMALEGAWIVCRVSKTLEPMLLSKQVFRRMVQARSAD